MRTKFLSLFLFMSIVLFSGCKEDEGDVVWDVYPVVYCMSVTDADGNDLLNPATPDALDYTKIKAVYKNKDYSCQIPEGMASTKAYLPQFYGLQLRQEKGKFILYFGELEGAESYRNETIILDYGDGSSDEISFNRDFKWNKGKEPLISQKWFLNGKEVSDNVIQILR
ncbi:MAG: hypothetical protein ACRCZQ_11060 [Bacteroidales bacterium]